MQIYISSCKLMINYFDWTERHKKLGPVFREKLGPEELVFVSDCAAGFQVFKHEGQYPEHVIPEAWTLYLQQTGRKRGLFFM